MSEFKIEKNVPMPSKRSCIATKYPFGEMKVGDSILVAGDMKELDRTYQAAVKYAASNGMKFTRRKMPNGHRIWRIK